MQLSTSINPQFVTFFEELQELDLIKVQDLKILLCHSNPYNLDLLYLLDSHLVFNINLFEYFFRNLPYNGFFFGHSHFVTFRKAMRGDIFAFNPGSLGESRDGLHRLTFAILEPQSLKVDI